MGEAASAVHAGKETIHVGLGAVIKYIAPLGGALAGYFFSPKLGGNNSLVGVVAGFQITGTNAGRIAAAVMGMVWGLVGALFWSLRSRGGMILELIGGVVGGFFIGAAIGQVPFVFSGAVPSNGFLDNVNNGIQTVAGGG